PTLSVIVPATDAPQTLSRCEQAIRSALGPDDELIVVTEPPRSSPAAARNEGAASARGEVLVFVDSDVLVHPDALARLRAAFTAGSDLVAVFGSYDDAPTCPGLVSQFRNLLHHHLHQRHPGAASTFWSGLGAVRRHEFLRLGGFDTARYAVPAVEDIELGMRLRMAGGRIELRPDIQGTHLKSWTLSSMMHTDFRRRGVPWALMCLERRSLPQTLNLSWRERMSTLATLLILGGLARRRRELIAPGALALVWLDAPFYALLHRRLGFRRALLSVGLHALHRAMGMAAVPGGLAQFLRRPQSQSVRRWKRSRSPAARSVSPPSADGDCAEASTRRWWEVRTAIAAMISAIASDSPMQV